MITTLLVMLSHTFRASAYSCLQCAELVFRATVHQHHSLQDSECSEQLITESLTTASTLAEMRNPGHIKALSQRVSLHKNATEPPPGVTSGDFGEALALAAFGD